MDTGNACDWCVLIRRAKDSSSDSIQRGGRPREEMAISFLARLAAPGGPAAFGPLRGRLRFTYLLTDSFLTRIRQ